ncbi:MULTISPECIES: heterocyst-inhibiting signaling peptide PatS [unclassified Nostoc]
MKAAMLVIFFDERGSGR